MADPLKKVRPGEKLTIHAKAWNRMLDASDQVVGTRTSLSAIGSQGPARAANIVHIKNESTGPIPRWGIMGVTGVAIDPSQDPVTGPNATGIAEENARKLAAFESNPITLAGVTPVRYTSYYYVVPTGPTGPLSTPPPDHTHSFAIAIEPIDTGSIGMAAVGGCVPVKVHVRNEWHRCARVKDGSTQLLETCVHGPAQILWLEDRESPLKFVTGPAAPTGPTGPFYYDLALLNSTGPLVESPPRWAVVVF